MKKIYLITAITFLSAIFLSGCLGEEGPAAETTPRIEETTPPEVKEVTSDTILDEQIFSQATSEMNPNQCAQISDTAKKNECKRVIQDFRLTDEAVQNKDISKCSEVEDKLYRSNCEYRVNSKIKEDNEFNQKVTSFNEELAQTTEITSKAGKELNASLCDQIEDTNSMLACKLNVISALAVQADDPELCNQLGEKTYIEQCKDIFEPLPEEPPL